MATMYGYHILDDTTFEDLVVELCRKLFGIGIKSFPKGRDSGRDSSFEGTAELYPSKSSPWKGKTIIQAKHSTPEASCSNNNFHTNPSSIINKEIQRLKEIQKSESFDNYILFTNRKLTGGEHPKIKETLKNGLNITNVEIIGSEDLDT